MIKALCTFIYGENHFKIRNWLDGRVRRCIFCKKEFDNNSVEDLNLKIQKY